MLLVHAWSGYFAARNQSSLALLLLQRHSIQYYYFADSFLALPLLLWTKSKTNCPNPGYTASFWRKEFYLLEKVINGRLHTQASAPRANFGRRNFQWCFRWIWITKLLKLTTFFVGVIIIRLRVRISKYFWLLLHRMKTYLDRLLTYAKLVTFLAVDNNGRHAYLVILDHFRKREQFYLRERTYRTRWTHVSTCYRH